jgi:hypothetical protein
MVSGGGALIEVSGRAAPSLEGLRVTANGRDVTTAFRVDAVRQSLVGLVDGLRLGPNAVEARRGGRTARLDLINHPIEGPILSGEHLKPFVCNTAQSGLGEPLDANCSAPTRVEYFYRSTAAPAGEPRGGRDCRRSRGIQAVRSVRTSADRSRNDNHDGRAHGPIHRARGIRHHQPCHLPHRDSR